jgi:ATP-dependent DNA ligase
VVGWTDPEGSRPYLGAQLLAYYGPYGKLIYAGRAGTGIETAKLERLWRRLPPLATDRILPGHVQLDPDPEDTFDRFATQR